MSTDGHSFDLGQDLLLKAVERARSQPWSDCEGAEVIQLLLCYSGLSGYNMMEVWGKDEDCCLVSCCCRLHAHHLLTSSETRRWNTRWSTCCTFCFLSSPQSQKWIQAIKWIAARAFEGTSASSCWNQTPSDYLTRLIMSVKPNMICFSPLSDWFGSEKSCVSL